LLLVACYLKIKTALLYGSFEIIGLYLLWFLVIDREEQ